MPVALVWQGRDRVVLGDARGILQVYDHATGELLHNLEHKTKSRIGVVDVSLLNFKLVYTLLTKIFLDWKYAQCRVYCRCVICSGSECSNSSLVFERDF